jgi:tRNA(fMet)-specific endonuclease VapC
LDTDSLSFFFRGNNTVVERLQEYLKKHESINLSVITYYEILNGLYFKDARNQLRGFEFFAANNRILPITESIAQEAATIYADLRKNGQPIGHNDVLIAATAIQQNLTLVTNNTAHFQRITSLKLDNWLVR